MRKRASAFSLIEVLLALMVGGIIIIATCKIVARYAYSDTGRQLEELRLSDSTRALCVLFGMSRLSDFASFAGGYRPISTLTFHARSLDAINLGKIEHNTSMPELSSALAYHEHHLALDATTHILYLDSAPFVLGVSSLALALKGGIIYLRLCGEGGCWRDFEYVY